MRTLLFLPDIQEGHGKDPHGISQDIRVWAKAEREPGAVAIAPLGSPPFLEEPAQRQDAFIGLAIRASPGRIKALRRTGK